MSSGFPFRTDTLLAHIADTNYNKQTLTDELVQYSFLSDTVMNATCSRTPFFTASQFQDIMVHNSPVSERVWPYLKDALDAMDVKDKAHKDTITEAQANDTLRTAGAIERELARLRLFQTLKHDTIYTLDSTFNAFIDTMELTAYQDLDSVMNRLSFPLDSASKAQLLGITTKVTPKDTLQSLLKEVLEIGVDHYYSGDTSWTSQDILDLREYAALCPFKYGPGVYHARVLLLNMDTSLTIYQNICEEAVAPSMRLAAPIRPEKEEADNHGLKLYPNPTTGAVTIDCQLKDEDVAELRIFDMSGRQVYRNNEVCGANTVELQDLSEGLYHCVLVINGNATLSEKLVILRE